MSVTRPHVSDGSLAKILHVTLQMSVQTSIICFKVYKAILVATKTRVFRPGEKRLRNPNCKSEFIFASEILHIARRIECGSHARPSFEEGRRSHSKLEPTLIINKQTVRQHLVAEPFSSTKALLTGTIVGEMPV